MDDQRVSILVLEYQSLRSDLVMRSGARFQFLGFITASAAILATGLGSWHVSLVCLGAALFVIGLLTFWRQGQEQALISARIAHLEVRINELVSAGSDLLSWETAHQKRSFFNEWILGLRLPAKARSSEPDALDK